MHLPASSKLTTSIIAGALVATAAAVPNGYTIYWADEFNLGVGKPANPAFWNYDIGQSGWGNNELEDYTSAAANSHIVADTGATDGLAMQIEAIKTTAGYTSARLKTEGKLSIKYGYIESRLKMPYGQGIWPAFWMLGSNITSVGWPACGEADVMENVGSVPNTNWGSLHAPGFNPSQTYVLGGTNQFHNAYHLFQGSWSPNNFTFYVDDNPYHSETVNQDSGWPFNLGMFFIMNIAVGGNWPGSPNSTTVFPQKMLVDYVRVYRLTGVTSNEVVSFFASQNSKFVSAENAGAGPLDCNRTTASTWEQFLVVDLGSNKIALRSQANGKFVAVQPDGSLLANGSTVTTAGTFQWTPNADGTVYLRSLSNGKYVTVRTTVNPPSVVASAGSTGIAQALGVTCYGQMAAPGTPAAPTGIAAMAAVAAVSLSWPAVRGAVSYEVYASSLPGGAGMAPMGSFTGPSCTLTGLKSSTPYWFAVTALNAQGMSMRSKPLTATPN